MLGSRVLRQAADSYARAARAPVRGRSAPDPAGDGLRRAARLLSMAAPANSDPVLAQIALIVRLIALGRFNRCAQEARPATNRSRHLEGPPHHA